MAWTSAPARPTSRYTVTARSPELLIILALCERPAHICNFSSVGVEGCDRKLQAKALKSGDAVLRHANCANDHFGSVVAGINSRTRRARGRACSGQYRHNRAELLRALRHPCRVSAVRPTDPGSWCAHCRRSTGADRLSWRCPHSGDFGSEAVGELHGALPTPPLAPGTVACPSPSTFPGVVPFRVVSAYADPLSTG